MKLSQIFCVVLLVLSGPEMTCRFGLAVAAPDRPRDYLPKPAEPTGWNNKRVVFAMHGKPWREVLVWFAEQAQMSYLSKYPPPVSTFSFNQPDGRREYTLVEIYDILNNALMEDHKHCLVRGKTTLSILCADEQWHPIPRVKLKELVDRGHTEVVEVVVTMDQELIPNAKRSLGNFGRIAPLENGQVMIQGDVASVTRAVSRVPMTDAP